MKRLRMGLVALSAITSIGSAFAFSPAAKTNSTTYYAVKTGSGTFHWTANAADVSRKSCAPTVTPAVCTIMTNTAPSDNLIPAGHSSTKNVYQ